MANYIPLDPELHADAGFRKGEDYEFAAKDTVAPIVAEELAHIVPMLPLVFVRAGTEGGGYRLAVLQSLQPGANALIRPDGKWSAPYVPALYRGYPFALLPVKNSNKRVLCVDTDSPQFVEKLGQEDSPFFRDNGQPSEIVSRVLEFWRQYEKQREITQRAVDALAKQGLIVAWKIKLQGEKTEEPVPLEGIFRIDEAALNDLHLAGFEALRLAKALPVAFAQLFSQHRLDSLARLHQKNARQDIQATDDINIEKLFGNDDIFRF